MSCLNLKFPPARKAWKIFATKIRRKLWILQPPKKKFVYLPGRNRVQILQPPKKKFVYLPGRNRVHRRSFLQRSPRCTFKRKQCSHVFVDKLFRPALDGTVLDHGLRAVPAKCGTLRSIKMMEKSTDAEAGTSSAFAEVGDLMTAAGDDMWESVAMASPLMRRIDERAEEFITKFRAAMVHQEMAAGDL